MTRDISFAGSAVRVEYEGDAAAALIDFLFARLAPADGPPPHVTLSLRADTPEGGYSLSQGELTVYHGRSAGAAGRQMLERLLYHLADRSRDGLLVHAAALTRGDECLLFPGRTGCGKTTLAGWLSRHGYGYLTDELVYIPAGTTTIVPFTRPLNLRTSALPVLGIPAVGNDTARILRSPDIALVWPDSDAAAAGDARLSRIVFPLYGAGAALQPRSLSSAEAGLGLMACLINARNLEGHGFTEVTRIVRDTPAYHVRYADLPQIAGWIRNDGPRQDDSSASHAPIS